MRGTSANSRLFSIFDLRRIVKNNVISNESFFVTKVRIRITGDLKTNRLLGAQIVGSYGAEVSKRIDVLATALFNGMKVEDLNKLDLSYTPPLGSPWDPVQTAAQAWAKQACSTS